MNATPDASNLSVCNDYMTKKKSSISFHMHLTDEEVIRLDYDTCLLADNCLDK